MRVLVYEDGGVGGLAPLALTRPAFGLRCGAATLLDRQRRLWPGAEWGAWVRPELAGLCRLEGPALAVNEAGWPGAGPLVLVNARWLAPEFAPELCGPAVGLCGGEVAFVAPGPGQARGLTARDLPERLEGWRRELPAVEAGGRLVGRPWELVEANAQALEDDYRHWCLSRPTWRGPEAVTVVGPRERLLVAPSARLEPFALVDTTGGPVLVDDGAAVQAFSRLQGPCYVGPGTQVLGARVRGSSLGPQCRVGGEVEASVIQGHSNKAHEGFLGHSYLGEWVNLGAGTQTSDLRTDYGEVSVPLGGRPVRTGLTKVGSFVGDHVKTSMGVLLNTGSAVGPFALLLASGGLLPKGVPPFGQYAHGRVGERSDLREMFETAAVVMGRRGREWTAEHAEFYFGLYERTAAERRQAVRDAEQRRLRRAV